MRYIKPTTIFGVLIMGLMVGCGQQVPPPVGEWVEHQLGESGVAIKLPPSTGDDLLKSYPLTGESAGSQVGQMLFVAKITPLLPSVKATGFDPSRKRDCEKARKAWEYRLRGDSRYRTVQPSGVQAIKGLSGPEGDVYGFLSRVTGASERGSAHIRSQTIYLPDGAVLDMQCITPSDRDGDKQRAMDFFNSVQAVSDGLRRPLPQAESDEN